jgi:hypothetical protein
MTKPQTKLAELKRLVDVWQQRLALRDWNITIRWAKDDEDEGYYAEVSPHNHTKEAEIVFARPGTHQGTVMDPEVLVVHELLHLHFAPFKTPIGSALEDVEENIVNLCARMMVALDRRDEKLIGRKLSKRASIKPKENKVCPIS